MTPWNKIMMACSGIYLTRQGDATEPRESRASECVTRIDGKNCTTKGALFAEFSQKLAFPDYFGKNWSAFEDCISGLEWLPCQSHVIIVEDAECLLQLGIELLVLLRILRRCAKDWTEFFPGEVYKVVFVVDDHSEPAFLNAVRQSEGRA
jgi:RNAse (barnase) inhibitor barstar